jgi:RND family efflux transporter MFP subunit
MVHIATDAPNEVLLLTGEVRARHEVDLAFRVGGKIQARLVDIGSEIRAEQELARLDPQDLQLNTQAAQAQLTAAESEVNTAQAERNRYADLLERRFVSQAAFDQRQHTLNTALARRDQALALRALSGNQAAYASLKSDFPGVISAVLADAGQVVAPGQVVLRLARSGEQEVVVAVPEGRIEMLKQASQFTVKLWVDPNTVIQGELRELGAVADAQTRSYPARIRLIDPPASLRLGMTAQVTVGQQTPSTGIRVPLTAVGSDTQQHFVWVAKDNKLERRAVAVAAFREDGAILASGLQAGEPVVISGIHQLTAGQQVKILIAPSPAEQH